MPTYDLMKWMRNPNFRVSHLEGDVWEDIQAWLRVYHREGKEALDKFTAARTDEDAEPERVAKMRYNTYMKETWLDLLQALPPNLRNHNIAFLLRTLEKELGRRITRPALTSLLYRKGVLWHKGKVGKLESKTTTVWYYSLEALGIESLSSTDNLLARMNGEVRTFKPGPGRPPMKPVVNVAAMFDGPIAVDGKKKSKKLVTLFSPSKEIN